MTMIGLLLALGLAPCLVGFWAVRATPPDVVLHATRLRVEYQPSPSGVDVASPRFSWRVSSNTRGKGQTAYRIFITELSPDGQTKGRQVGDSRLEHTTSSDQITVTGWTPAPDTRYEWSLLLHHAGPESPSGPFTAQFWSGLLTEADWQGAKWINGGDASQYAKKPDPVEWNLLRSKISLKFKPSMVRCFIGGPSYYRAFVNGQPLDDHRLGHFTTFEKRILYDAVDCTELFDKGDNMFGLMLGKGWWSMENTVRDSGFGGSRTIKVLITAYYTDGTSTHFTSSTNGGWEMGPSWVVYDDVQQGTTLDGRLFDPCWNMLCESSLHWTTALTPRSVPPGVLRSSSVYPQIRSVQSRKPVKLTNPAPGVWVADFGINWAGVTTIRVPGNEHAGRNVTALHGEALTADGTVLVRYRKTNMTVVRLLRGDGKEETVEGLFTYFGFQYVQVTGLPSAPKLSDFTSIAVNTAVEQTGFIHFGGDSPSENEDLLNKIQDATLNSMTSNLMSATTDCPQRERRGWLGDAQVSAETIMYNFDAGGFYTKFIDDIRDAQQLLNDTWTPPYALRLGKNNSPYQMDLPPTVPFYGHGNLVTDPAWSAAYVLLSYWMYRHHADLTLVKANLDSMVTFLDNVLDHGDQLYNFTKYGDWCAADTDEKHAVGDNHSCHHNSALVSGFYHILQKRLLIEMADAVGGKPPSKGVGPTKLVNHFNAAFLDGKSGTYGDTSKGDQLPPQTAQVLGLAIGAAEKQGVEQSTLKALIQEIKHWDTHNVAGIVGTKYMFPVLADRGRLDLAAELAVQTTEPSYGYWIRHRNATSLYESWWVTDPHFPADTGGSLNHAMFGSQGPFWYRIAGLYDHGSSHRNITLWPEIITASPGFLKAANVTWGPVKFAWALVPKGYVLNVSLPPQSAHRVILPATDPNALSVQESGEPLWADGHLNPSVTGVLTAAFNKSRPGLELTLTNGNFSFEVEFL